MSNAAHGRRAHTDWNDLDALVIEEMEALNGRPREPRQRAPSPVTAPRPAEARRAPRRPEPAPLEEAAFEENPDDEEAFIEHAVDYLRERPDAEALLEAIRAALYDEEPEGPVDHGEAVDFGDHDGHGDPGDHGQEAEPGPGPRASSAPPERPPASPEAPA